MVSLAVMVIACVALAVAASNEAIADSTITHPGDPVIPPSVPAIVISEKRQR